MAITAAQLVHNPDFNFYDLVHAQNLAAAATTASTPPVLGPEGSYCPHNGQRVYDAKNDEMICLVCGDFISHAQLEAERTTPAPVGELP